MSEFIGLASTGISRGTVEVIIVAFNSDDSLEACLRALPEAVGGLSFHVTVVDNASDRSAAAAVQRSGIPADVLRQEANLGYAGGVNAGIRNTMLRGCGPDAILLLNPDVELPAELIERLYSFLVQSPNCGAISPQVVQSYADTGGRAIPARQLWGFPPPGDSKMEGLVPVDRLPGCCMLIKPAVFSRIGLLDESYFLYWEEIDFCLRARKVNFDLLVARDIAVIHHPDGKWVRRHRVYYMWRNQVHFALKNYGPFLGRVFLARRLVANFRETVSFLLSGKPALVLSGIAGLWAGLRGETGQSTSCYAVPEN
jgi:N-acetylglucosaminyl-diphospho-decaprenol L-rhamnosyltransferase